MENVLIKINGSTVSIKRYILDHYAQHFFNVPYDQKKKFINDQIRTLVGKNNKKDLSQHITKFLIDTIALDRGKSLSQPTLF